MRTLFAVAAIVLVGCAGGEPTRRDLLHGQASAAPDELDRLMARLPGGADRCAGARVGAVASNRRAGVQRLSTLGALASVPWSSRSPVLAYAEVRQEDPDQGRRPLYALAHVTSIEAMRAHLEASRRVHVRWNEGPGRCPGPACCPGPECWALRAEAVDEHTVRFRRGPWRELGVGVELRCADLARRFGDAIEVASWTAADGLFGGGGYDGNPLGFDVASLLQPFGAGLRRVEQYRLPDAELAEEIALLLQHVRSGTDDVGNVAEQSKVVQGDLLEIRTDVRWEDLELLAGDEAREREAIALEAAASRPLPLAEIDYQDLAMVREQVDLRTIALREGGSAERRPRAEELRTVLENAAETHPGHAAFVEQLLELLLGELDDPRAAVDWAERVLTRGPHDRRAWQVRRRRALARADAGALAEALVADGIVRSAASARAAASVLGALGRGVAYEQAEGAWLTADALRRAVPPMARARGRLALGSLAEGLLALADIGGSSRSVHLRVESEASDGTPGGAAGVAYQWDEGARRVRAGAASTDAPDGAFRLLRDATAGARGRTRVVLALTPIGGDLNTPDAVIAVEGDADGSDLELTRASVLVTSGERTPVRWERFAALVGDPLAGYEVRLFPPPNLHVDLADGPEAAALLERASDEPVLSCIRQVRRESTVRCNGSPQRDVTRRAWRRIMAPLVFR